MVERTSGSWLKRWTVIISWKHTASHVSIWQRQTGIQPTFAGFDAGHLVVQVLLAAGADVELTDGKGNTALHYAAGMSPDLEVCQCSAPGSQQ